MSDQPQDPQAPIIAPTQTEEIRISDLIVNIRGYFQYIIKHWWVIIIIALLTGVVGFIYAYFQDEDYITESSFIVDSDAASNSFISSMMSLAGAFMGASTGSSTSDGFSNELLHGIIQSRRVIKAGMLQDRMLDGEYRKVGNYLVELYPDWAEENEIDDKLLTSDSLLHATPLEDTLLELMYLKVVTDHMEISYDEYTALNRLLFRSLSRDMSVELSNYILQESSDFFIESATQKESRSLEVAQMQADSFFAVLQAKEKRLAQLTDRKGYGFRAQDLLEEGRLLRDVETMSIMHGESMASLEIARNNLMDKKPIIQVVDAPEFSTHKEEIKYVLIAIIAVVIGGFLGVIFFILRKLVSDIMADEKAEDETVEASPAVA
jgi:capsule polysaccharide export protein KpsE/RkpR